MRPRRWCGCAARTALRRMVWRPSELGAAQAYVCGDLDVDGDLGAALEPRVVTDRRTRDWVRSSRRRQRWRRLFVDRGATGRLRRPTATARDPGPDARPTAQSVPRQGGDQSSLRHLERVLPADSRPLDGLLVRAIGKSPHDEFHARASPIATSWTGSASKIGLARATRHAAARRRMWLGLFEFARRRALRRSGRGPHPLARAEVLHRRGAQTSAGTRTTGSRSVSRTIAALTDGPFDAVASIEMGEHVGREQLPDVRERSCTRACRPGGRVLVQQMSRRGNHPGGGPFIESFIAPDMHMRPIGETVASAGGFRTDA